MWSSLPASRSGGPYRRGLEASIHVGISDRDVCDHRLGACTALAPPPPSPGSVKAPSNSELYANRTISVRHGATENGPLNDGQQPRFQGVRLAVGTGYNRERGIGRTWARRRRELSTHPNPVSRFAPNKSLCPPLRSVEPRQLHCLSRG
jgi:hypothetical protein